MSDKILLQNMMFYAFHGVYEYERKQGQRFYMDLELTVNAGEAGKTDDLNDAVDYTIVYQKTKEIVESHRYRLLEALAANIANEVLGFAGVDSVTLRIRKPAVPLQGQIDYVQLEITRSRPI